MKTDARIRKLLEKLVSVHLALGVQPSELADAAFEDDYQSIEIVRDGERVCVTVTFLDTEDDFITRHEMRYLYARDRRLLRIEQKVGGRPFTVQWDRDEAVEQVLAELVRALQALNSARSVARFISTIPEHFRGRLRSKLRAVA